MVARGISNFAAVPRFLRKDSVRSLTSTETANVPVKGRSKTTREGHRRAVRFEVDENDIIVADVHEIEMINEADASQYFTTRAQSSKQKKQVAEEATEYAREHAEFIRRLEALFNSPLARSPAPAMGEREVIDMIFEMGESDARGIECRMCPQILRHKQWAMKTVLRRQAQLKRDGVCPATVSKLLRTCCEQVGKNSRDMALKLALSDDIEAQKAYDEMDQSS
jgi:hypothetical protein